MMKIVTASTAFVLFISAVSARADLRLLTYGQWSRLAPAKRARYVQELRDVLLEMEAREAELGLADESQHTGEFEKSLELFLRFLPGADAEVQPPVAPDVASTEGNSFFQTPVPVQCTPPKFDCASLSASQRGQRMRKFLGDRRPETNQCLSGGFFSSYPNRKGIGQCHIIRSFPPNSRQPQFQCGSGYALCNPLVFCTQNADHTPVFHCEPFGGKHGFDITARCNNWYNGQSASACDPSTLNLDGIRETWDDLKTAIEKHYQSRCEDDSGFQALFCKECQSVAERVYKMNDAALNLQCGTAGNPIPLPSPSQAPASREPSDHESDCALKKMVAAGKRVFRRYYSSHPNSSGGYCGQGVGNIILNAGFKFATAGRNAINYMQLAPEYGFVKLDVHSESDAPPGAILVYSGPCSAGYPKPEGRRRCTTKGDRWGHVTVKGDDGHYYTDGRTSYPHIRHRYLVGVFVPGPQLNEKCEGRR